MRLEVCGVVEERGAGPKKNDNSQRISLCEKIYKELKFCCINNKAHVIFSSVNVRYLGRLAVP